MKAEMIIFSDIHTIMDLKVSSPPKDKARKVKPKGVFSPHDSLDQRDLMEETSISSSGRGVHTA